MRIPTSGRARTMTGRLVGLATLGLGILALAWLPACAPKKPVTIDTPSAKAGTTPAPASSPAATPAPAPVTATPATPASVGTPGATPAPTAAARSEARPRPPAPAPLVGQVSRTDLEGYVTWKELRAQDYAPDPASVQTITDRSADVTVLAIVATWCSDSKREVPRFFKIADQAKFPLDRVTLVAVDRTKKDAEGLTEKHRVTRVPTFVFFRGGQEIGRVVEKVATTLENDIATILRK